MATLAERLLAGEHHGCSTWTEVAAKLGVSDRQLRAVRKIYADRKQPFELGASLKGKVVAVAAEGAKWPSVEAFDKSYMLQTSLVPNSAPAEETITRVEEHRLKRRVRDLEAENRKLVEQLSEGGEYAEVVAEVLARQAESPAPNIAPRERSSGLREGTPLILASDWHIGETVSLVGGCGRNYYDLAVAEYRAVRFFRALRWKIGHERHAFKIRDLILAFSGDLITGYIHRELIEQNSISPTQEVNWLLGQLIAGIDYLLEDPELVTITFPCSYGNHGRTTEKRQVSSGGQNSFEWLLYACLERHYKGNRRVRFVIDLSAHQYVQAYEFNLHFHHGDEVKFGGGIGGISVPLLKRVHKWDNVRRSHIHHVGHFHQYSDFGRVLVNGSLIGYGPYAMSIGADFEEPRQIFYVLDSVRGKSDVTPLWVSDEAERKLWREAT